MIPPNSGFASLFYTRCIAQWVDILAPARLYLPCSTVLGSLVSGMMSLPSFVGVVFASSKIILCLLLLVYCSQLIIQLSFVRSMDFTTNFLPYGYFNGILSCMDKLTKWVKFIPGFVGEGLLTVSYVANLFFLPYGMQFWLTHFFTL